MFFLCLITKKKGGIHITLELLITNWLSNYHFPSYGSVSTTINSEVRITKYVPLPLIPSFLLLISYLMLPCTYRNSWW